MARELASLDFTNLIGAPLISAVEAQFKAAITTVNFIRAIGMNESGEVVTVPFKYKRDDQIAEIEVPILSIVPIPFLRIEEFKLEFLAKINSISYSEKESELSGSLEGEAKFKWLAGEARIKASVSYQRESRQGTKKTSEYSMKINITAVQDELPGGLEKVLALLEASVAEQAEQGETS